MARSFDLRKGQTFDLKKDEGLTNIKVTLGWKAGADLDACAFLLGEDGEIIDNADFVYYKSANREKDFSKEEFKNKKNWRALTRPMSADGSVLGSLDDLGEGGDEGEDASEEMTVNLDKVRPDITEIVFCVTIYQEDEDGEKVSFGDVREPFIAVEDEDSGEELCRYNLRESFSTETAVVAGSLIVDDEGNWQFKAEGQGYNGGMKALIDIYAP